LKEKVIEGISLYLSGEKYFTIKYEEYFSLFYYHNLILIQSRLKNNDNIKNIIAINFFTGGEKYDIKKIIIKVFINKDKKNN
jgi:hypothetical protein